MKNIVVFLFALSISLVSFDALSDFGSIFQGLGTSDPSDYYKGREQAARAVAGQRRKQRRLMLQEYVKKIPRPLNVYGTEALLREREYHLNMILSGGAEWRIDKIREIDSIINYKAGMQAISELKLGKTKSASEVLRYYSGFSVAIRLLSDGNFEVWANGVIVENRMPLDELGGMIQGLTGFVSN